MLEINESLQTLKPSISTAPSPAGLGGENGGGSCGGNGGILLDQALNKSLSSWFSVGGGGHVPREYFAYVPHFHQTSPGEKYVVSLPPISRLYTNSTSG